MISPRAAHRSGRVPTAARCGGGDGNHGGTPVKSRTHRRGDSRAARRRAREPQTTAERLRDRYRVISLTFRTCRTTSCSRSASGGFADSVSTGGPDMPFGAERLASWLAAIDPVWRSAGFCVGFPVDSIRPSCCMPWRAGSGTASPCEPCTWMMGRSRARPMRRSAAALHACDSESPSGPELRLEPLPGGSPKPQRERRAMQRSSASSRREWLLSAHHRDDQLETCDRRVVWSRRPDRRHAGVHDTGPKACMLAVVKSIVEARCAPGRARGLWAAGSDERCVRSTRRWLPTRVPPAIRDRCLERRCTVACSAG